MPNAMIGSRVAVPKRQIAPIFAFVCIFAFIGNGAAQDMRPPECVIPIPDRDVSAIAFTSDSRHILAGGYKQTLFVFDARTGRLITSRKVPGYIEHIAISPDGKTAALGVTNTKTLHANVLRLDSRNWKPFDAIAAKLTDKAYGPKVTRIAFAPSSKSLSFMLDNGASGSWHFDSDETFALTLADDREEPSDLTFLSDGSHCMLSKSAGLSLMSVTGQVRKWGFVNGRVLAAHPTEKRLAIIDDVGLKIFDVDRTNRYLEEKPGTMPEPLARQDFAHRNSDLQVAFSPRGNYVAYSYWAPDALSSGAKLFDIKANRSISLVGQRAVVFGLVFSPDGKYLAAASDDKAIRVWRVPGVD